MRLRALLGRSLDRRRSPSAPKTRRALRTHVESLEGRRLLSGGTASDSLLQMYGKIPLSFEANVGQTDAGVQFLSRGAGYTLFLTPDEAVLSLVPPAAPGATSTQPPGSRSPA